ncbi:MAG: hypothetical protein RJA44_939 [Pseudomonadota bacterium]
MADFSPTLAPAAALPAARGGRPLGGTQLGLAILCCGVLLTLLLWQNARRHHEQLAQDRFEYRTERIQTELAHRLDGYSEAVHSVAGLLGGMPGGERLRWRTYFERVDSTESYPGRHMLAFAPRVSSADLGSHVERTRLEGVPDYALRRVASGEWHYPLAYMRVFTPAPGLQAGLDMASDPLVQQAIERTVQIGRAVLTGPLAASTGRTETEQVWALLTPTYSGSSATTTPEERRQRLTGVVFEIFNPMHTGSNALGPDAPLISLQISLDGHVLLSGLHLPDSSMLRPRLRRVATLDYGERQLQLEFVARDAYMDAVGEGAPTGVLVSGLIISVLLAGLVGVLADRRRRTLALSAERSTALREAQERERLERHVQERTEVLRQTNTALQLEVQERRRIETELVAAREQALAAAQAKADFLANMSHEIRTPMHAVLGMAALLEDTTLGSEQRDYVETIRISGDALLATINDILDFSKIESGMLELEQAPFELGALIEDAVDMLAPRAAEKDIELLYSLDAEVPRWISGDATRLRQILVNLLSNALKFTARGEVCLSAHLLEQTPGRLRLQFAVRDSGIGIAPEQCGQLFRPFTQADSSTTRRYGGSGLGLAICQRLTHLMQGEISVESVPGQGSVIRFSICAQPAEALQGGRYIDQTVPALLGRRVLLVDDSPGNLRILQTLCLRWGLQAQCCRHAAEALERLAAGPPVDAVILDRQMPDIDGVMLAQAIRHQAGSGPGPALLLLSSGSGARQVHDDAAGQPLFDARLVKPFKHSQLLQTLQRLLAPDSALAAPAAPAATRLDAGLARRLPLRILVVEDSQINQKLAIGILARLGYHATVAGDGLEALELLRRQPFDLVFMDLQMPQMDGLEATRQLLADPTLQPHPRIIATTANALSGDRERCLAAGMDDYLAKPMLPVDVQAVIERWAPRRARNASPDGEVALIDAGLLAELRELDEPGQPSLLQGLLDDYLVEAPAALRELRRLAEGDGPGERAALVQRVHKLAGVSASLGASALAGLCRQLEQQARGNAGRVVLIELVEQLDHCCTRTCSQLQAL